jgi:hypothetical protein
LLKWGNSSICLFVVEEPRLEGLVLIFVQFDCIWRRRRRKGIEERHHTCGSVGPVISLINTRAEIKELRLKLRKLASMVNVSVCVASRQYTYNPFVLLRPI